MSNSTISIIIVVLLVLALFFLSYFAYLKFFRRYTRERFAFAGLSVITTLIGSFMLQMYSSVGYVSACINTSNLLFDTNFSTHKADVKEHIITVFVIYALMQFIIKLHRNWKGPISEVLHNKKKFNENQTIIDEAFLQLRDFLTKEKLIVPYNESSEDASYNIFSKVEDDKMPWYENVYELLTFTNRQYHIDLMNDYYPDEKCFISTYGLSKEHIAILCVLDSPDETTINNFIDFTNKQNKEFIKLIIAVRNYDQGIEKLEVRGKEITIRNENEMLFSLVDFSDYKEYIQNQYKVEEINVGNKFTLEDVYVPLDGTNIDNNEIGQVEEYILSWINETNNKHLAVLGEYGCGKSVLSLKVTYELLKNRTKNSRIPILIELRGKSPRNLSVIEILSTWASNYRLDPASLLKLHKAGKLVLIFEGFDEMDMIGDKEMRLNHFQRLWEFAIPKSKIIITGRPNFFLDDKELRTNLGIDKPYEQSHYCEAIYLNKFDKDQIKEALRNVESNTKEQVLGIVNESGNSNFYDLVSRPAILYLVSIIWKEIRLSDIKNNINSAIVISEFIKYVSSRQEGKNIEFPLSEKEREYFMIGIAVGMLKLNGYSNQINKVDLENLVLKLYRDFPDSIPAYDTALQSKRKSLKIRMIDNNQAEDTILTDVRSCGILVNDLTRKDYFKFAHKSFLEYQVSSYFVESILQDRKYDNVLMNSISNALDISLSSFKHSDETISFTSEVLLSKLNLKPSTETNPKIVCKKLLKILYPTKILNKFPYSIGVLEMYPKTLYLFITVLLGILMSIIARVGLVEDNIMSNSNRVIMYLIFIISFLLGIMTSVFILNSVKSRGRNRKRLMIWLKCSRKLGISNEIIKGVFHKGFISYIEGNKANKTSFLFKFLYKK